MTHFFPRSFMLLGKERAFYMIMTLNCIQTRPGRMNLVSRMAACCGDAEWSFPQIYAQRF